MVGVYGATGFLGRLVSARLGHMGVATSLIGRSGPALERLKATRPDARIAVAKLDDPAALRHALTACHVVVNCAPAGVSGEPLIRAAMDTGIPYADAAGEQHHIRHVFDAFDKEAVRRGVPLVPALGFDYAIGDCLARLAAGTRDEIEEVTVAYAIEGADVSGNSAQAAVATAGGQEVVYRNGQWRPLPFELDRESYVFPSPIGRRQMSRYGSGEVITVPRHTKTRRVRTLITSTALCPHPAMLPVFPVLRPVVGWARRTPARALLRVLAGMARRPAPAAGVAPDAASFDDPSEAHDSRRFMIVAEVRACGTVSRAMATGGNFHQVTAAILAQGAVWLREAPPGVHSPATAFPPARLLDALAADGGVRWSVL